MTITRDRWCGSIGCRRKSLRWPPTWLNLSALRLALSWYWACRFCRGGADRGGDLPDPDAAAARAKAAGEGDRRAAVVCRCGLCRGVDLFSARAGPLTKGLVIPTLPNGEAVFLAAGVLGATIMPHVIYLHSSLTQHLHGGTRKERYNATRWDVAIAMTIAGFVNLAMMATAAAAFHFNGHTGVADLDQAYRTLEPLLSHAAATIFGLSLVAAGLSSTVVGTLAGQVVMQGFIRFHIPLWFRRAVTMLPSFVVILLGLDPTRILVMSQVLLSFGIALALVPLLIFTSNAQLMGDLVNTRWVRVTGWVIVAIVVSLNGWLIVGSLLGVA